MSETLSKRVTIANRNGLHLRPAGLFAELAGSFKSDVSLVRDGDRVDGKSIMSIVTLAAQQGTELSIEVQGEDASAALEALVELVSSGFGENEAVEPTSPNT